MGKKASNEYIDTLSLLMGINWTYKAIPPSNIVESMDNIRVHFEDRDTRLLAENIKENGLVYELIAHPGANGKLELIDGHRRLRAIKILGLQSVPVKVADTRLTREQVQALMLITDRMHKSWSKYDLAKHCAVVFQTAPSMSAASEMQFMSLAQFRSYLGVGLLDMNLIRKATDNKIPFEFMALSAEKFATNALSKKINLNKNNICNILADKYIAGKMQPISVYNACLGKIKNLPSEDVKYWLQSDNDVNVLAALLDAHTNTKDMVTSLSRTFGNIETKIRDNAERFSSDDVQRIRTCIANLNRAIRKAEYGVSKKK